MGDQEPGKDEKVKASEKKSEKTPEKTKEEDDLGMEDDWGDDDDDDDDDENEEMQDDSKSKEHAFRQSMFRRVVTDSSDSDSDSDVDDLTGPFALHNLVERGDISKLQEILKQLEAQASERKKLVESNEELDAEKKALVTEQVERELFLRVLGRRDPEGCTPLHVAILSRKLECVKVLAEFGLSSKCNNVPLVHLIIGVGSIRAHQAFALEALEWVLNCKPKFEQLEKKPVLEEQRDDLMRTVFHLCAEFSFPSALSLLMRQDGADELWQKLDIEGLTCAHVACRVGSSEVLKVIASHEPARKVLKMVNLNGMTPMHFAAQYNWADCAKILLDSGLGLEDMKDSRGRVAVDWAEVCGSEEAKMVLSPNASPTTSISSAGGQIDAVEKKKKKTLILSHEICSQHHTCKPSHTSRRTMADVPPENVNRLKVLLDQDLGILRCTRLEGHLEWQEATRANLVDVLRVHDYMYIDKLRTFARQLEGDEIGELDGDTSISRLSFEAAMFAAGSMCDAIDNVMKGSHRNAFCAVRPPGHHAGPRGVVTCKNDPNGSYGFCLLSNAAIGAAYARNVYRHQGVKNVAIIDFDVHHGNGTEACVKNLVPSLLRAEFEPAFCSVELVTPSYKPWLNEDDPEHVFFASVHGYGKRVPGKNPDPLASPRIGMFYPSDGKNFGFGEFPKAQKGEPKIIDVGQNSKSRVEWRASWQGHILPALAEFDPDLIIISAGFDAHKEDDINMGYISALEHDYYWLTRELVKIANKCCNGRVVSILEGGYKIQGGVISPFARSVCAHVSALAESSDIEVYDPKDSAWEADHEEKMRRWAAEQAAAKEEAASVEEKDRIVAAGGNAEELPRKRSRRSTQNVDYKALNEKLNEELKEAKRRRQSSPDKSQK